MIVQYLVGGCLPASYCKDAIAAAAFLHSLRELCPGGNCSSSIERQRSFAGIVSELVVFGVDRIEIRNRYAGNPAHQAVPQEGELGERRKPSPGSGFRWRRIRD